MVRLEREQARHPPRLQPPRPHAVPGEGVGRLARHVPQARSDASVDLVRRRGGRQGPSADHDGTLRRSRPFVQGLVGDRQAVGRRRGVDGLLRHAPAGRGESRFGAQLRVRARTHGGPREGVLRHHRRAAQEQRVLLVRVQPRVVRAEAASVRQARPHEGAVARGRNLLRRIRGGPSRLPARAPRSVLLDVQPRIRPRASALGRVADV